MSLVAYASSEEEAEDSEEEEADEEEESEEGPGRSKGLFSALPPPKGSRPLPPSPPPPAPSEPGLASRTRKRTQPVRIAAPQLGSGDSDSEEDEPVKKQPTSQGHGEGTGLSALLPQPKNLTVKETNRPLLPYVFSRKAAEKSSEEPKGPGSTAAPSKPKVKPPSLQAAASAVTTTPSPSAIKAAAKSATLQVTKQITQEENESDEEVAPENYFSLPERREPPAPLGPEPFLFTATVVPDDLPPGTEPEDQDVSTAANAPLEFKTASGSSAASHGWAPKPGEEYSSQPYPPYPGYSEGYYGSGYYQEIDPAPGPLQEAGSDTASATTVASSSSSSSSSSFMDDEAFKRLQGKRNRGREEINFVEIKGDDQLSGAQQWLTKSLTEEQNMKSFSKKKGEQPTGQQRRKHQITYLIHQAKERELELKNTWAENKLSRRQTQAKYGF
ncbi:proline-rich protein PRCC isoform X1 [Anolis carolinensis]|uniref:proline-rich protein PRCC isoform X1 n=1 Tax=Anolis carolinensis TaxID=28377 RepID=UPI002F2B35A3